MDSARRTDLCDRLVAQLGDPSLTRFQLIDMATVLMLVQRNIDRGIDVPDRATVNVLNTSLQWIRDHAQEASVDELRSRFAAAVHAASNVLARDAAELVSESPHRANQQRAGI